VLHPFPLALDGFAALVIIVIIITLTRAKYHELLSTRKEKRVSEKQGFRRTTGNKKRGSWEK
jgi:hypothetical protein